MGYAGSLNTSVSTLVQIFSIGVAGIFGVGLVANMLRAQVAQWTEDSQAYSRSIQQAVSMVMAVVIAAYATEISGQVSGIISGMGDEASIIGGWKQIASIVITTIVSLGFIVMAVTVMWQALKAQFAQAAGASGVLSSSMTRIVGAIFGLTMTVGTVQLFKWIVTRLFA